MNWVVGLKRAAALACGVIGILVAIAAIGENMRERPGQALGFSILVIVVAFAVYRAACWLIDGFAGNSKA